MKNVLKKTAASFAIASMLLVTSCKSYDKDIQRLDGRVDHLAELIQTGNVSLTYIPSRLDGHESVPYYVGGDNVSIGDFTLKYDVVPAEIADEIMQSWQKSLSVKGVYTSTKVEAGDFVSLSVKSASAVDGVLSVVVSGNDIDEKFFDGSISLGVSLQVTSGSNTIRSEYVGLEPSTHYVGETGKDMGEAVNIDGTLWAPVNVGATSEDLNGSYFTYEDAKTACPNGWNTPSKSDLENVSRHYYTLPDMFGYYLSGSADYSSGANSIFLPAAGFKLGGKILNVGLTFYWSSTMGDDGPYYLGATGNDPAVISGPYAMNGLPVRCVKK